ncbi:putative splicing factor 3a [Trypanosoma rangeli]|uniref:Putative splicing factor 3a n=1 Tax=Trypanosoma rangeli TaxID=5698 RepID=A0A422P3I2_TRYRA|nr:putative splicing factor 3a [Trypanosoma rangeli]RNF12268.1 putative splicing factor 3a [Trypanosoma rangeli]|eukprot:RNF12268.1 putative splicing factor 3a [Trypanosoma rangeli]
MLGGVLEKIRLFEADIEHHIDNIVQQKLLVEISNKRHQILRDHFITQEAEAVRPIADKLLDLYLDQDDIVAVQEAPSEGEDVLSAALKEFEAQIADIREYHRTFRDLPPVKTDLDHPDAAAMDQLFSVGERYGSCLDLEPHYHRYSNFMLTTSKRAQDEANAIGIAWEGRVEYFAFIPAIPNIILNGIDAHRKVYGFSKYKEFVDELLAYLINFYGRVKVMEKDVLLLSLARCDTDAEEYWSKLIEYKKEVVRSVGGNSVVSFTDKTASSLIIPPSLRKYTKTFALWPITHLEVMIAEGKDAAPSLADVKAVIHTEGKIARLLQTLLFDTLQETEKVLLRDFSKTAEELEWERKHQQEEFLQSLEEARMKSATTVEGSVAHAAQYDVMTTLNPTGESNQANETAAAVDENGGQLLDRDGKPVAQWLIHLQQLHKKFYCEVCGGTVYVGPKAFKEHFGAERHAEGLRRLGVTVHLKEYAGISSIRKVIEMRDKVLSNTSGLRKRLHEEQEGEEMQDAQGNVITAGAYKRFQISRKGI